MLHVIVHSPLNVSGEQLTDFAICFSFCSIFLLCFRFSPPTHSSSSFFFSFIWHLAYSHSIFSIFFFGENLFLFPFFFHSSFVYDGKYTSIYITRYSLYFMWHFLFIHVSLFCCCCIFFLIIAAHHHFYGAKFVVIAHTKHTHTHTYTCILPPQLLTCYALLFIIIYESEYEVVKKEEESYIHTYIDYNLLK